MKVTENITVYQCEFCKKKLFKKSAMISHENLCFQNPINIKPCLSCVFLSREPIDVEFDDPYNPDGYRTQNVEAFKCSRLDKLMFPWSIERKKLHEKYETFSDQEPMPKECKEYKTEANTLDLSVIFNDFL